MNKPEQLKNKIFENDIKREIINFFDNEKYQMVGGEDMVFSDEDVKKIAKICSQESTYDLLFKQRLNGKLYSEDDAKGFIEWIKKGWGEQTHFVFLIRKNDGEIVGAVDIKSPNLERAEIGYWADENCRGFMTNTVNELLSIAKDNGFLKLFAGVRSDNPKSIGVLERSGFKRFGEEEEVRGHPHLEYEIDLNAENKNA